MDWDNEPLRPLRSKCVWRSHPNTGFLLRPLLNNCETLLAAENDLWCAGGETLMPLSSKSWTQFEGKNPIWKRMSLLFRKKIPFPWLGIWYWSGLRVKASSLIGYLIYCREGKKEDISLRMWQNSGGVNFYGIYAHCRNIVRGNDEEKMWQDAWREKTFGLE